VRSKIKVLLISVGYVTDCTPSDKQFVSDLIRCIDSDVDIALWALNDAFPVAKLVKLGNRTISYKNQNRNSNANKKSICCNFIFHDFMYLSNQSI
jgi:hypothetical protein